MRKKYLFARGILAAAIVLWIINVFMIIPGNNGSVAAFRAGKTIYPNVIISAEGTYGTVYMNKNAKEIILKDMAEKIGINRYEITSSRDGNIETTVLAQSGINGNVRCCVKTTETQSADQSIQAKQEFSVRIELIDNAFAEQEYTKITESIFKKYDIKPKMEISYYE